VGAFLDDGPTSKLIRQVLGTVAEFDKAMTVAKLRGARKRKRRDGGKCEGRKLHLELRLKVVCEAKRLRRASPLNGKRRPFHKISKVANQFLGNDKNYTGRDCGP
jgi:DNA invertase Pin-like site-specific DNA recombinase